MTPDRIHKVRLMLGVLPETETTAAALPLRGPKQKLTARGASPFTKSEQGRDFTLKVGILVYASAPKED
jgi:hypothetical protein